MKPISESFARILPVWKRIFPPEVLERLWRQAQPRNYRYKIKPTALPAALLYAYLGRIPSTSEFLAIMGDEIGTHAKSTLSDFLANPVFAKYVLARTARSDASPINNNTIGIGMTWMLELEPQPGCTPFQLLAIHRGGWNDAAFAVTEEACTPPEEAATDVRDRGFSGHRVIQADLKQGRHFLQRLRKSEVRYFKCIKRITRRKRHGALKICHDVVAEIGNKTPVQVRLVWAQLRPNEQLILATDRMDWTLEKILEGYRSRWPIEPMHKVLKDTIGLAHLYSLQESGMIALLKLALLLAGLVWVGLEQEQAKRDKDGKLQIVASIREGVKTLRRLLINRGTWKRNLNQRRYSKTRKRRKGSSGKTRKQVRSRNISAPA